MKSEFDNRHDIEELMLKYTYALEILKTEIGILINDYSFRNNYNPVEHVKSRIKTEESAIKKLQKKGYEVTIPNLINHVHDMIGVRIVCSFLSDVYQIVDLLKKSKQFEIRQEKNYIEEPKESGYISYHLNVLIPLHLGDTDQLVEAEIQIRTIAMDFWASLDHKMQYKFPTEIPDEIKEEMFNCSIDIKNLDHKMERLNAIMQKYNK